tara:strand:- start:263 stop:856 length:594 start_codon:yes stop_codon:yes gene_type:complete
MIEIKPINKKDANYYVGEWHRHNKPVPFMQISFALGVFADSPGYQLVGVIIVGQPCGRPTGKDKKRILEIRRVCFKPEFNHLRLKRWHPREDNQPYPDSPTLRNLPIVVYERQKLKGFDDDCQIPIAYDMTTPYKFPSKVLEIVELFTKRYFKNITKLWTYILKKENGRYIKEAGYVCDKVFKRRNRWKRRFVKEIK